MPYPMSNGKWRGKRMIAGKVRTKVCDTKREAKEWEVAQTDDLWTAAETPTVTALEWANRYLDFARERFVVLTWRRKRLAFRRLFDTLDRRTPAQDIRPAHVLQAMRVVAAESTPSAVNELRIHLAAAWEWGRKYMALPEANPFRACEKMAEEQRERYVPPQPDYWLVYNAARPADRVYLLAALHTAARKGELHRLQWGDVDLANKRIRLGTRKRKGGNMEYNWIPLTSQLAEALAAHKQSARGVYVFTKEDGQPYIKRGDFMDVACRRAGVRPFGMHAIRHLAASIMAEQGVPVITIQAILRHQRPTTTDRYLRQLVGAEADLDAVFENALAHKLAHVKTVNLK